MEFLEPEAFTRQIELILLTQELGDEGQNLCLQALMMYIMEDMKNLYLKAVAHQKLHASGRCPAAIEIERYTTNVQQQAAKCVSMLQVQRIHIVLQQMSYAKDASLALTTSLYDTCTDEILDWVNSDESDVGNVFLLSGAPATGKTTVATTVAKVFHGLDRLGSSFRFDRSRGDCTPEMLFPTIAHNLFDQGMIVWSSFQHIVENAALRKTTDLEQQFDALILKPMKGLKNSMGPTLIVIDGLDACPGDESTRWTLCKLLAEETKKLPPQVRILVTTCAEEDILDTFHRAGVKSTSTPTV